MTREQELIAEYEVAMNAPLSERDKKLMIDVLNWIDNHPNWHKVDNKVPPPRKYGSGFSVEVLVTDGKIIEQSCYRYSTKTWSCLDYITKVTHWMYSPELPK